MLYRLALAMIVCLSIPSLAFAQDYLLRPGDVVEITVQEDENLNRQVVVRPDGKVSLPLAGTLTAAGGTPEALQREITRRLKESFVSDPTVTVSLVELAPDPEALAESILPSVYVLGEVVTPGRFELTDTNRITVLQALSLAGGLDRFAAKDRIQVRRAGANGESVMIFDYEAVERGNAVELIELRDGDVVVVPERGLF